VPEHGTQGYVQKSLSLKLQPPRTFCIPVTLTAYSQSGALKPVAVWRSISKNTSRASTELIWGLCHLERNFGGSHLPARSEFCEQQELLPHTDAI